MTDVVNKCRTLVLGLGVSGLSCARYLQHIGCEFDVADSRESPSLLKQFQHEFPAVKCHLGEFNPNLALSYGRVVISPGLSRDIAVVRNALEAGIDVSCDIQLLRDQLLQDEDPAKFIVITGSNGKSTVTTLVGEMCAAAGWDVIVAGNIGKPVLDAWLENRSSNIDAYVLELSSFQLESCKNLQADVATILNFSADHLDRYASYQAYCEAKHRIYTGAKTAVVNLDEPKTWPQQPLKRVGYQLTMPQEGDFGVVEFEGEAWFARGAKTLVPVSQLKLAGRHNQKNILAAMAIAAESGVAFNGVVKAISQFTGLAHRCQFVAEQDGVVFIDDSKATNEGAAIAAIAGLADSHVKNIILIAGGLAKGCLFDELSFVVRAHCKAVVLIGESKSVLSKKLNGHTQLLEADDMPTAVKLAKTQANHGDYVLLSPACASFDMFNSFEHRGELFQDAVSQLGDGL